MVKKPDLRYQLVQRDILGTSILTESWQGRKPAWLIFKNGADVEDLQTFKQVGASGGWIAANSKSKSSEHGN